MVNQKLIEKLVKDFGEPYSEKLKIRLEKDSKSLFEWFLASILFGARISEKIAIKTFNEFRKSRLLTPEAILKAGWDRLVEVLDMGGYVRYDFKTATKILEIAKKLKQDYNGNLLKLYEKASDSKDLEKRLLEFKGVGETTINIFLRELREKLEKSNPPLSQTAFLAAYNLGLIKTKNRMKALENLKLTWEKYRVKGKSFLNLETALTKIGKNYCKNAKCNICPVKSFCKRKAAFQKL